MGNGVGARRRDPGIAYEVRGSTDDMLRWRGVKRPRRAVRLMAVTKEECLTNPTTRTSEQRQRQRQRTTMSMVMA